MLVLLQKKVKNNLSSKDDISLVGLFCSSSQIDGLNEEFSDLDFIGVTETPDFYFNDVDLHEEICICWFTFNKGCPEINYYERRCLFGGGLDADFIIL